MKYVHFPLLVFLWLSCTDSATTKHESSTDRLVKTADSSSQKRIVDLEDWEGKGKKRRDTNYQYLDRILVNVLQAASQHKTDSFFNGRIDTSAYQFKNMYATFQFGSIFSKDQRHLLIKRFINEYDGLFGASLLSDIYILKKNRFVKLVSDTANIAYTGDTLNDINFDSFKDFVVSQYSGAGCCPRDLRIAYLYNHKTGGFEPEVLFNPEFDNKHKLIYEMDYGHPGFVSLSKSKWHGLSKVMVESISPMHFENRMDSFVRPYSYTKTIYPVEKTFVLKAVPEEYKKLTHYEYFISYQQ